MKQFSAWFVGEGSLLVQAGEIWREQGHVVSGVASADAAIAQWAKGFGIPVVAPGELAKAAAEQPFDYLFSVVNLRMLDPAVLRMPRRLAVNFHDGPLPRYAGINATVWALLHGESSHGVTFHVMTEGADEGDILVQRLFPIAERDTAFSLNAKCFTAGIECFRELASAITEDTLERRPQDFSQRNYFGFYDRPGGMLLDWTQPAEQLDRLVRALDFGAYPNPVGTAKVLLADGDFLTAGSARVLESRSGEQPGTILAAGAQELQVATATQDLVVSNLRHRCGRPLGEGELAALSLEVGKRLPCPSAELLAKLAERNVEAAKSEGFYARRLAKLDPLAISLAGSGSSHGASFRTVSTGPLTGVEANRLASLLIAFLARRASLSTFDVAYAAQPLRAASEVAPKLFAQLVPVHIALSTEASLSDAVHAISRSLDEVHGRMPYSADLALRRPDLRIPELPVAVLDDVPADPRSTRELTFVVKRDQASVEIIARSEREDAPELARLARAFSAFVKRAADDSKSVLARVPLAQPAEIERILNEFNATAGAFDEHACIHQLFQARARLSASARAVSAGRTSWSYGELDRRANAVAHELRKLGVGPDKRVGIYCDRTVHLPQAALAVHKAGGAYVPLDPKYPRERIEFMIDDAELSVIVTDARNAAALPKRDVPTLVIDDPRFLEGSDAPPESGAESHHLAYVIYTSGSTGKPKGVMVEHRNAVNFFAAMDRVLTPEAGTWLAVTSLSFDISVLELLWTLTRGFHVVVYAGDAKPAKSQKRLDFSLFYFSSEAAGGGPEHYRLLLEGARFADANGFAAVWTPERHFHAFGGLYPNPSVSSAALAMVTQKVALRAGSCVSPLHSPLRIAEEWSMVDNLSNGRVGISFASGWQPNDFAIKPENFADRKDQMFRDIEMVRKLWRGESVSVKNGEGKSVNVRTLPRPVQKELPVWVTAAGNPETFEAAGKAGAHLLTHLLGQTLDEVRDKVRVYRKAWKDAGHAGQGTVTLMLHTFVGEDDESVKAAVRGPMKEYLRSAVGLIKEAAWNFPTFKQKLDDGTFSPSALTPEELDVLLDHAFERYYVTSGLFGSHARARGIVEKVREIDVDEIACLIDFGVDTESVLRHLPYLGKVLAEEPAPGQVEAEIEADRIGQLIERHGVTHFQCTPSMANLILLDDQDKAALRHLKHMLVGGEALPATLAAELKRRLGGQLVNVYGPTETTVWSTFHVVQEGATEIPIGRPLLNTDVLIVDAAGQIAPIGEPGELVIGGKGVTRGYLNRPELTEQRFVAHPLRTGERVYRTGDLASLDEQGTLHFHGRIDHQIKIRGYRVELGEIEARVAEHPSVHECAVIVREDEPGNPRLIGYVVAKPSSSPSVAELRQHLLERVPEYMVPVTFVMLDTLPKTPNQKIDRKALPAPNQAQAPARKVEADALPKDALEEVIAGVWREVLNLPAVGVTENFFDLGGHSLLSIQLLGKLKPKLERPIALVDLFRFPTIRSLAQHLSGPDGASEALDESAARGAERARLRRAMMGRR